ncbi:MAG: hypothetical protein J4N88_03000 [Chloroflexi bacterium]|nr:hypothetical protein [Chloroflexota bacterium]
MVKEMRPAARRINKTAVVLLLAALIVSIGIVLVLAGLSLPVRIARFYLTKARSNPIHR